MILAGGGNDTVNLQQGGNDVVNGGDGVDTFNFGNELHHQRHRRRRRPGNDVLKLGGAPTAISSFQNNFINVEKILLAAGNDYMLVLHNAMWRRASR